MTMSYADAMAAVTAPGQRFETTDGVIRGAAMTVFRNAPPSLRELVRVDRAPAATPRSSCTRTSAGPSPT